MSLIFTMSFHEGGAKRLEKGVMVPKGPTYSDWADIRAWDADPRLALSVHHAAVYNVTPEPMLRASASQAEFYGSARRN